MALTPQQQQQEPDLQEPSSPPIPLHYQVVRVSRPTPAPVLLGVAEERQEQQQPSQEQSEVLAAPPTAFAPPPIAVVRSASSAQGFTGEPTPSAQRTAPPASLGGAGSNDFWAEDAHAGDSDPALLWPGLVLEEGSWARRQHRQKWTTGGLGGGGGDDQDSQSVCGAFSASLGRIACHPKYVPNWPGGCPIGVSLGLFRCVCAHMCV